MQPAMRDKGVKVTVAIQQGDAMHDAAGRDQRVDRLADGNAPRAQLPIMTRRRDGDIAVNDANNRERCHGMPDDVEFSISIASLKHFSQDKVAHDDNASSTNKLVEADYL